MPFCPGRRIRPVAVTLLRKRPHARHKGFKPVDSKSPLQAVSGAYATSFRRPHGGKCKVTSALRARPRLLAQRLEALRLASGAEATFREAAPVLSVAAMPVSRISQAYPDRVEVRGRDLSGDLMGRLSFTEYFHLLLTGERADRGSALLPRPAPGRDRRARDDADERRRADDARSRPGVAPGRGRRGDPRLRAR